MPRQALPFKENAVNVCGLSLLMLLAAHNDQYDDDDCQNDDYCDLPDLHLLPRE